ncbi:hypothetical protein WJX73_006448 [Symbiochloris irregularis]|uniref:DNA repair metallo-beta-lactamase domain-containing protein n=1 Tax=Symbiochloris irregularis TaxID=706552 RepID=A0AAW1NM35_9CHLO
MSQKKPSAQQPERSLGKAKRSRGRLKDEVGKDSCTQIPAHTVATPGQVVELACQAVRAEAFNPATLFQFGSQSLTDTSLGLQVAMRLQLKLYISRTKRKAQSALKLPESAAGLLTAEHTHAKLHAVRLRDITFKQLHRLMRKYRGRYSTMVAFLPSGAAGVQAHRQQRGPLIIYTIPFSQE